MTRARATKKIARVVLEGAQEAFERRVPDPAHRELLVDGAKAGLVVYKQKYEAKRAEGCFHPHAIAWPVRVKGRAYALCLSCARLIVVG